MGNRCGAPPPSLFPMKTAGLYHLGSKGLDGGYPTLHQISRKAFPLLLPRVFPRMRLHFFFFLLEPLERMSDEAEIHDVQNSQTCPVKSEPLQRDGPSAEKQTGPRRALDGVWPPEIRPSSAFLLIRSSSAFPPTPHSSSTPSFLRSQSPCFPSPRLFLANSFCTPTSCSVCHLPSLFSPRQQELMGGGWEGLSWAPTAVVSYGRPPRFKCVWRSSRYVSAHGLFTLLQ